MKESRIETLLRQRVRGAGGRAYKFVSPGNAGVPDRLVCLPGGRAVFVELKAPGRTPTDLQRAQHERLRALGFEVWVVDGLAALEDFAAAWLRQEEVMPE